jgi:DNA-binding NtrC family response regulator
MRAEQTETIETIRSGQQLNSTTAEVPLKLRIAERSERDRVQRLLDLAYRMLGEAETLARDKAFTDVSHRLEAIDPAAGVDFYNEVERFETGLIKLALDHTGGNQAKAARLLHIKPTTLYSKIKLYGIEY